MIPAIYPSSTLRSDYRSVKDATKNRLAIVTDGSRGNYLFGSESSFEDELASAAWEESNADRIIAGVERARADFAHGAYVVGTDAAIALSNQMRQERMQAARG